MHSANPVCGKTVDSRFQLLIFDCRVPIVDWGLKTKKRNVQCRIINFQFKSERITDYRQKSEGETPAIRTMRRCYCWASRMALIWEKGTAPSVTILIFPSGLMKKAEGMALMEL